MMNPEIMGVLNVTPDSFSDGGQFLDFRSALARGKEMSSQGADWIDVGGESTRPGAEPVSVEEEIRRVVPVVEGLAREGIKVSIDTQKPEVARLALEAGAQMVNDVGGLRLGAMRQVVAEHSCEVCIMHMPGDPTTMQSKTSYQNVVLEVSEYLTEQANLAEADGIAREKIILDPGIGFGKTVAQNLEILGNVDQFVKLGYRVLIGASRKSFVGKVLGTELEPLAPEDRLVGTLVAHLYAQMGGARILRVHDVVEAKQACEMAQAIDSARF